MTYLGRFNKLLRQIQQLETNDYYSDAQILDQFIAGLKNKLIKKVCPHAPTDLATAIKHAKNYKITMEEANHTKLVNLAIRKTSSAAKEKIDQLTKKVESYFTNQQQLQKYQPPHEVAAPRSNPSNHTISPAQIAQNANLSDIFPFEFEANESPFLLSNAAVNEQKAITAMYTEATVEGKAICLILDSRSARSIITYQLMQQLKQNVDRPVQTFIVTTNDCKKKLSSMKACISSEEEYETRTYYFYKACHREQFGSPKRSRKWDKTSCLTCEEMLPEECNWIDVAMRGGVYNQTCQYALSISEKLRKKTSFDVTYNSALNKLYYYLHNAEMIFDLAIALINGAT
ncbi:hypothetical protein G9A89_013839 [Geosiphon pyriformis]|nr:hypothetical protein G9A89_013839 [Geosiphon pyriformis]